MTKKIILTAVIIITLICGSVYATEAPELNAKVSAEDLQSAPTVGTETPDLTATNSAEELQNTDVLGNDPSEDGDYSIPEEWWRGGEDGIMPISDNMEFAGQGGTLVQGDTFISEDHIEIIGKQFDGNVFLVGQNVNFGDSIIFGDLFVLSQAVNMENVTVIGNMYLAGQSASFNAVVTSGNMYLAGSAINLAGGSAQDVFVAGSAINLDNSVQITRNLYAGGTSVTIASAEIGRDANISANDIQVEETVTVNGKLNKDITLKEAEEATSSISYSIGRVVRVAISAIAVCGLIFLFGKDFIEKQKSDNVVGYFFKNLGKGVLFTILVPLVAILLMLTGLTGGLSVILIFIYIIIFWVSTSVVSVALTANITKNMEYNVWRFYGISILVAIVIAILKQLPYIGVAVALIVAITGMGIVFSSLKTKKENKVEAPTTEA